MSKPSSPPPKRTPISLPCGTMRVSPNAVTTPKPSTIASFMLPNGSATSNAVDDSVISAPLMFIVTCCPVGDWMSKPDGALSHEVLVKFVLTRTILRLGSTASSVVSPNNKKVTFSPGSASGKLTCALSTATPHAPVAALYGVVLIRRISLKPIMSPDCAKVNGEFTANSTLTMVLP